MSTPEQGRVRHIGPAETWYCRCPALGLRPPTVDRCLTCGAEAPWVEVELDARLASEDARARTFDDRNELLRTLTEDEQNHRYVGCCWTWRNYDGCVRLPVFRLATPHGHMDFCREHIGPAIAMLSPDWLDGWAFREPLTVEVTDDIPF